MVEWNGEMEWNGGMHGIELVCMLESECCIIFGRFMQYNYFMHARTETDRIIAG